MKKIHLTNPAQLASVVPQLLGFHPSESIVIIVLQNSKVELAARFDIELVFDFDQFLERIRPLRRRHWCYLLVAFTETFEGEQALKIAEAALSDQVLAGAFVCDGVAVRPLHGDWALPLEPGSPGVLPDRAALVATVAGPGDGAVEAAAICAVASAELAEQPISWKTLRISELLEAGLAGEQLTDHQLAELTVLVQQPLLREQVLLPMSRSNADEHVLLWLQVCDIASDEYAPEVLGLLGMAAWLRGDGALQVCCVERGLELDPENILLNVLETANLEAVPPNAWETLREELLCQPVAA